MQRSHAYKLRKKEREKTRISTPRFVIEARQRLLMRAAEGHVDPWADIGPIQALVDQGEVTEAVLNHISGSRGGIAGVYQRHDWATEKRAALDAWATHVRWQAR
jgi:hypothetical protein